MKKTDKKKILSADEIAELADKGEDISRFFTNSGKMKYPIQRVNVDLTVDMLKELDSIASELNISRQAVIKAYLRQALDQHYLAKSQLHQKTAGSKTAGSGLHS
ncbi:MAG: CopG family transcriptional regulator [Desulfobacterales bacterium]|nr:CopG family transcriptional regulator [Desulfobacterales bacterium]